MFDYFNMAMTSTVKDRDIEIMGVKFNGLNDDQYQLLSMIRHSL